MSSGSFKPDSKPSAYEKAIALLSRREHSARELKSKLAQRGFDDAESSALLENLQAKNFQSDDRFGEMLVRSRIAQGYGPRWIIAEMQTHGIGEAAVRGLFDATQPDWPELARAQLRRRYGGKPARDLAERGKRSRFLLRRGFDAATVSTITRVEGVDGSADDLD